MNFRMYRNLTIFTFMSSAAHQFGYRKIASSNTSRLEAHVDFYRLLMKGIFGPYVLWHFDKKLIFWLVTRIRIRDYTVCRIFDFEYLFWFFPLCLVGETNNKYSKSKIRQAQLDELPRTLIKQFLFKNFIHTRGKLYKFAYGIKNLGVMAFIEITSYAIVAPVTRCHGIVLPTSSKWK